MSPRKHFDRFMVANDNGRSLKLARFTDAEFRALVQGIWPIASMADPRGAFMVGELPATAEDVAFLAPKVSKRTAQKAIDRMRELGMLEFDDDLGGEWVHDWDEINPAPRLDNTNARRQALFRDKPLRDAVRLRDNNRCRYCGVEVEWKNRRGPIGGTYDHVDPDGENTEANLVVACRGCNSRKGSRTPDEAGLQLLPIQVRSNSVARSEAETDLGSKKGKKEEEETTTAQVRAIPDFLPDLLTRLRAVPSWDRELSQGADAGVLSLIQSNPGVPWMDLAAEAVASRLDTSPGSLRTDSPVTALNFRLKDHRSPRPVGRVRGIDDETARRHAMEEAILRGDVA